MRKFTLKLLLLSFFFAGCFSAQANLTNSIEVTDPPIEATTEIIYPIFGIIFTADNLPIDIDGTETSTADCVNAPNLVPVDVDIMGTYGTEYVVDFVSFSITHTFDADIDLFLISPDGTEFELLTDVGGAGDNFTGTILADGGAPIAGGTAPFDMGPYQPEGGAFATAFTGDNVEGTWSLKLCDDAGGDTGTIDAFSIAFIAPATCPQPFNLAVDNIMFDTADLSWDEVASATDGYQVEVFNDGDDPDVDTAVYMEVVAFGTNMTTATGLMAGTAYDYYVTADCGAANGESNQSGPVSFTTTFMPPANDACADATAVTTFPYMFTQDDGAGATNNDGFIIVTDCAFGMNDGVWYTLTGDGSDITVNIAPGAWDPELGIYTGSCGAFICEATSDGGGTGGSEEITFSSAVGTEYYINVGHWSGSTDNPEGNFDINITSEVVVPPDGCGQTQVSNAFENGSFIEEGGQKVANDLIVDLNTTSFSLNSITANLFSQGGIASVDILFYDDAAGIPGTQIGATIEDLVPTSQVIVGANFGFDVHEVVLDLPAPVVFAGTGTEDVPYWVQLVAVPTVAGTQVAWETTTLNPIGAFLAFDNDGNPTNEWNMGAADGVFVTNGDCTLVDCLAVTNISISNIMTDAATISWDDAGMAAGGYILSVFDAGADPDVDTPVYTENVPAGTTTTTATGLTGSSSYDVYITADCGGGDLSVRVMTSFDTALIPPMCGGKFYDTGGPGGDYQNSEDYNFLIASDDPNNLVTLDFITVDIEAGFDQLHIYDGDDATAPELSDPADGVQAPGTFTSNIPGGNLFVTFTSDGSVVRAGWDADVICEPAPTCLAPFNVTTSNIMEDSADIAWEDNGAAANGYIVSVFDDGADPDVDTPVYTENVAAGTLMTTATGLVGSSTYDVYVYADCGGGDISEPGTTTFSTALIPPACGGKFYDTGGPDGDFMNDELYTVVILPDNPGDVVTATFVFVNNTSFDILTVDIGDGVPQVVPEIPVGSPPVAYTSIAADGSLVFDFDSSGVVPNAGWDADITCGPPPACLPPANFMVTGVTDTTADFSWDEEPNASNGYIVTVFLAGDDPDVDTPIATENVAFGTNTATATGLTQDTAFDAYIVSDCDADGISVRSMISFNSGLSPLSCDDQFIDSGGIDGDYQNNESRTVTILPDTSGDGVTITFTYVDIESATGVGVQDGCWDFLTIYDGPDTSSPVLAATLCGEESGDGGVPSVPSSLLSVGDSYAATNPANGALTVVFTSDGSVPETGWVADVTCGSLSIDDFAAAGFNYYPNPTTGILSVGAKQPIEAIALFNILGQQVLEIRPDALDATLDLSSLSSGTYVMKSTINGTSYTHKVIKN